MWRPSAFAVLRFATSWNRVGRSAGNSATLASCAPCLQSDEKNLNIWAELENVDQRVAKIEATLQQLGNAVVERMDG